MVGRHVGGAVVCFSLEQFRSSFILVEYFRGVSEIFLRGPRVFVRSVAFPSDEVLVSFGAASMFEDPFHFVLLFAVY